MKLNKEYPVFANTPPWNALILLGVRKFKTISFPWKYRGKVYLYDSKSRNTDTMNYGYEYGLDNGVSERRINNLMSPGRIVGTVDVVGIRDGDYDKEFEILIANPVKFKHPVSFKWPKGAIRIAKVR